MAPRILTVVGGFPCGHTVMLQRRPNWFSRKKGPRGTGTVLLARARPPPSQPGGSQRRDPGGLDEPGPPWATWSTNAVHQPARSGVPLLTQQLLQAQDPDPQGCHCQPDPRAASSSHWVTSQNSALLVGSGARRGSAPPAALVPCPPGVATQRRSTAAAEAGGASPWPRAPALSRPWRAVEPQARRARRLAALARELWEQDVAPCTRVPGSGPRCCSHPALQDPACHRGAQSRLCLRAPEAAARNSRWLRGA